MNVPDSAELRHLQLQAMLKENNFPHHELSYIGERDGEHWYLVGGEHEVRATDIISCDPVEE
jgi:hypothetical protein